VSWTAPTDLGGGKLVDYAVSDGSATVKVGPTVTSHNFTGLTNGTQYTFHVAAETQANSQPAVTGAAGSHTARPGTAPTISSFTASANGSTDTVTVYFNVDTQSSGSATCHITGSQSWSGACSGSGNHAFGGLAPSSTHNYSLTVTNSYGSSPSAGASATTATPPPSVQIGKGVRYTGGGHGTCTNPSCAWISVTLQNFAPNTPHTIQCYDDVGGSFAAVRMTTDGNGYAHTDGQSPSSTCFFGYPGQHIWVVVDGQHESNHVQW
jgi:hypothetical protein